MHARSGVTAVAASSNGSVIYCTGPSKQVVALDAATGEIQSRLEASKQALTCLAVAPGECTHAGAWSMLVMARSSARAMQISHTLAHEIEEAGEGSDLIFSMHAHERIRPSSAPLYADNATVFCGGSTLALWNLESGEKQAKFTGHPVRVHTHVSRFAGSSVHACVG
jgi:hypothetical protein